MAFSAGAQQLLNNGGHADSQGNVYTAGGTLVYSANPTPSQTPNYTQPTYNSKSYTAPTYSQPLTADQQSAQSYINNSASGQGGMDDYVKRQQARYAYANSQGNLDLMNKLHQDALRVGYNLASAPAPTSSPQSYTGTPSVIGNTNQFNQGESTGQNYQDLYNQFTKLHPGQTQLNTATDNQGNIYNTTSMTPQQIYALQETRNDPQNAAKILSGMGLDMNGNAKAPDPKTSSLSDLYNHFAKIEGAPAGSDKQAPTFNVNDPTFMNKSVNDKLQIFKNNPALGQQEILRDKDMYNKVMNAKPGDAILNGMSVQDRLAQIHTWADQVRQASGISNDNASYGNNPNTTASSSTPAPVNQTQPNVPAPTQAPVPVTQPTTPTPTDANANTPATPSDQLYGEYQKIMDAMNNPSSSYWDQFRSIANAQGQNIYNQKQAQLNTAKQGISDDFFKKYLQARQTLANRGISNSGIANDSDFRLQLAKQGQLANLYSKMGTQDLGTLQAQQFNDLYNSTNKNLNGEATSLQNMYKNQLPYDQSKINDQMKNNLGYAKLAATGLFNDQNMQYKYDALDEKTKNDLSNLAFKYYNTDSTASTALQKMNSDQKIAAAKLESNYNINFMKVMGVDPTTGQPTLDAQKLMEAMRHNQATEGETAAHNSATEAIARMNADTNATNATTRSNEVKANIAYQTGQLKLGQGKLANSVFSAQSDQINRSGQMAADSLSNLIKVRTDYIKSTYGTGTIDQGQYKNDGHLQDIDRQIQDQADNLDTARESMDALKNMAIQPN